MVNTMKWLLLSLVLCSGSALANGDAAAGKDKSTTCQACHGADGNGIDPMYPKLSGQYASYLEQALRDYKSGERSNPIMAGFSATLSEQDIEDLAAYYASMESQLTDMAGN
jgi:cytochrome c553